jgi:hypothetical protein
VDQSGSSGPAWAGLRTGGYTEPYERRATCKDGHSGRRSIVAILLGPVLAMSFRLAWDQ